MPFPPLHRKFDARWDEPRRQSAIIGADHQVLQAKADLDATIRDVNQAVDRYTEALAWAAQIRAVAKGVGGRASDETQERGGKGA